MAENKENKRKCYKCGSSPSVNPDIKLFRFPKPGKTNIFRAPIHIVTGSAGCREGRDHFKHSPKAWSAFRSQDFGYTRFKAFNKTHINIEQVSVDLDGQVIDHFWVVKNKTL